MRSEKPKVLSEVLFDPMLEWVLGSVTSCNIKKICVVVGFGHETVKNFLADSGYSYELAVQDHRKGTAHAVLMASNFLEENSIESVLVLNGDSPFMESGTIMEAYGEHLRSENSATIISANLENSSGYGRIVRNSAGRICSVIEEADADEHEKQIKEVNSGAYWFKTKDLLECLSVVPLSACGEYYLTSVIELLLKNNHKVGAFLAQDPVVVLGANNSEQLEVLNKIAKTRVVEKFKNQGIRIPYDEDVIIGRDVEIGEGTTILSDVTLLKKTRIGKNCIIGPGTNIVGISIEDNANIIFRDLSVQKNRVAIG
jgi:bifunctional UDP-N-acetylglucosamine pyrophosphorylase/glucosamine-1-phosphate N-acetyltransferase